MGVTAHSDSGRVDGGRGLESAPDAAVWRADDGETRAVEVALVVDAECKVRIVRTIRSEQTGHCPDAMHKHAASRNRWLERRGSSGKRTRDE